MTRGTIKMIGKATANIIDVIAVVKSIRSVGGLFAYEDETCPPWASI
jgi:hypothetical protein